MKREISITIIDSTKKRFEFSTLKQIIDFCNNESNYWAKANTSIGDNVTLSQNHTKFNHFHQIINTFESWKDSEPSWDEPTFRQQFNELVKRHISQLSAEWIWHGHAFVPIWIELHEKSQHTAESFISTVLGKQPNNFSHSVDHLKGHILGYEFLMQDETELTKRRVGEKKSIAQLRNQLFEKNNELISEVEEFKDSFETWNRKRRKEVEKLYRVRKKLGARQVKRHDSRFNSQLNTWNDSVKNLERTYEELLRLRKPAKYWNDAAKKYGWQGLIFAGLLVLFGSVALVYLADFFAAWLEGAERAISLGTLQGAVIFASLVAVFAFLMKVFSRLAFSSFHLMRDAEEREQLTYLYLSLSEETNVEDESRAIILQALFSRSETGLLNQENGPTMPTISEVIRRAPKPKLD